MKVRDYLSVLMCMATLVACTPSLSPWLKAKSADTISAYQIFLARYPNDVHGAEAAKRLAALQEEVDWKTAQVTSSIAGYEHYLSADPQGAHVRLARENIVARQRADAWQTLGSNQTPAALMQFLKAFPSGPEADEARDQLAIVAGYRAELRSLSNREAADRERARYARRYPSDFPHLTVLPPDSKNPDYRVTSAPMSEQQATNACAMVSTRGQFCEVIQSPG
jgi:hypothetical protein